MRKKEFTKEHKIITKTAYSIHPQKLRQYLQRQRKRGNNVHKDAVTCVKLCLNQCRSSFRGGLSTPFGSNRTFYGHVNPILEGAQSVLEQAASIAIRNLKS